MILDRVGWPQRHAIASPGRSVMLKAVLAELRSPRDVSLEDIDGRFPLISRAAIWLQDSLGVGAADQIVIAHEILLAGDGLVVAQEVDGVHIAIQEVPGPVVEDLCHAMPHDARGATLRPEFLHRPARQMESLPQVLWP